MASIVVSDYSGIVAKLETLREKVGANWNTVTSYGSGVKPSVSSGTQITAKQVNTLVEAYFDFKEKWIGSATCSATAGNYDGYACSVTDTCAATTNYDGYACSVTDTCAATLGDYDGETCYATASCSVTLTCSSNCSHTDCSATYTTLNNTVYSTKNISYGAHDTCTNCSGKCSPHNSTVYNSAT